jgi:FtsP/CotA-like multicopper oxidase with cupredoxin domain
MNRRQFLQLSSAGVATIVLGSRLSWLGGANNAFAANQVIDVTITDARKEMVTHNSINSAQCYFWIYKMSIPGNPGTDIQADCPGPTICAVKGDSVTFNVTNNLDEPHSFSIPSLGFTIGPIAVGQTLSGTFTANQSGAFLYYDDLNAPVNRMMGLHGALVVRPAVPVGSNKFTPYDTPTTHVQNLYNAFGDPNVFPGLAWDEGDANQNSTLATPAFRQYVWLTHEASPNLFAEVGNHPAGQNYPAAQFLQKFLKDPFSPTRANNIPQYFTINGQSGFFSHFSPTTTPTNRVGEPVVIHILNAGLWTHSMHLHANHFYVTSVNGVVSNNPLWLDVFNVYPMDRVDYTVPYTRPPDVPNLRGIGLPDTPLVGVSSGTPVWPPVEEMDVFIPAVGDQTAQDINGNNIDMAQRLSPLCYPMHDHCEPSQTAQGGNYNMGLISGMYIIGDRNIVPRDFPIEDDFLMMFRNIRGISVTGPAPGTDPNNP